MSIRKAQLRPPTTIHLQVYTAEAEIGGPYAKSEVAATPDVLAAIAHAAKGNGERIVPSRYKGSDTPYLLCDFNDETGEITLPLPDGSAVLIGTFSPPETTPVVPEDA